VMDKKIRILVVDDQTRARQSLRALFSTLPQVREIQEAADGQEAVLQAVESQPDIVVMDIVMPRMDGLEAARQIKVRFPAIKIILLSMYGDFQAKATAAGADAFVTKGEPPGNLIATLERLTEKSVGGLLE
jgi:YesN/AraC family two-component response regulator